MIQSLRRGLDILEYMAGHRGEASVSEIARYLDVDPSTSSRLLATLEHQGFVRQDADTQRYRLGTKLLRLGNLVLGTLDVGEAARGAVRSLAAATGQTSHLAVLVDGDVVYIDRVPGSGPITVNTVVGAREPSYCTATGKALLSGLTDPEIRGLFEGRPLLRHTRNTLRSVEALIDEVRTVRVTGIALDREEFNEGVWCVAAPVRDHAGRVACAIGVSSPTVVFTDKVEASLRRMVSDAARQVSAALGSVAESASLLR